MKVATEKRSVSLPLDVWIFFDVEAEERGMSAAALLRKTLSIIAEQDLLRAVLDDGDRSAAGSSSHGERSPQSL